MLQVSMGEMARRASWPCMRCGQRFWHFCSLWLPHVLTAPCDKAAMSMPAPPPTTAMMFAAARDLCPHGVCGPRPGLTLTLHSVCCRM
jgi:hypothetical protein